MTDESLEDYCARLITLSLSRTGTSQPKLEKEFQRVSGLMTGLLITYGDIGIKSGLGSRFSAEKIDNVLKDSGQRELFKTSLLADSIVTNWSFVIGHQLYKVSGTQPTLPESKRETPLPQRDVDSVFKKIVDGSK